jgi:transposase
MAAFVPDLPQPTVLVLDKASLHKAHLGHVPVAAWAAAGLTRLFLPPSSSALNRIEIRWRVCPHYWLTSEADQTPQPRLQQGTDLLRALAPQSTFG